jgi:hypothetical protein
MKTEKEIWVEEILYSAENIKRVQANGNLFAGVQSRLHAKGRQLVIVPVRTVWLAAASIALLLALNISALLFANQPKANTVHSSSLSQNSFDIYSNS